MTDHHGYLHPWTLDDAGHALERWVERWRSAMLRADAERDLMDRLKEARFVEVESGNLQAIWRLPAEAWNAGRAPLVVADQFGVVKTVLPMDASKPRGRR